MKRHIAETLVLQAVLPFPGSNQKPVQVNRQTKKLAPSSKNMSVNWIAITALLLALLTTFCGIIGLFLLTFWILYPTAQLAPATNFSVLSQASIFVVVGIVGGTIAIYHSTQALLNHHSRPFTLPPWWIFAIFYIWLLGLSYGLELLGLSLAVPFFSMLLILGISIFPVFFWLSLARQKLEDGFPVTTWRRVFLCLFAGATVCAITALLLENQLGLLFTGGMLADITRPCQGNPIPSYCNNTNFSMTIYFFSFVAIPILEELIKPIPVILFMKKVSTGTEAFLLGLACGLGFDMVKTPAYIGNGYTMWANVAFERLGTSLLHGFGTAAIALGWFYLTHGGTNHTLKVIVCGVYAFVQHIVWNGTAGLAMLPAPFGSYIKTLLLHFGFVTIPFTDGINLLEYIIYIQIFLFALQIVKKEHSEVIELA